MKYRMIETDKIVVDEDQPRKELLEIEAFAESLNIVPSIEVPLIVEDLGDDQFFLTDGERRYKAAVSAGMQKVPCDVRREMSELHRGMLRLRIDAQHKAWTTQEQRGAIRKTFELWLKEQSHNSDVRTWQKFMESHKNGYTKLLLRFSEETGLPQDRVSDYLGFDQKAIDEIRNLHEKDVASFYSLQKVAREDPEVQEEFAERVEEIIEEEEIEIPSEPKRHGIKAIPETRVDKELKTIKAKVEKKPSPKELEREAYADIVDFIDKSHEFVDDMLRSVKDITTKRKLKTLFQRVAGLQQDLNRVLDKIHHKDPTLKLEVKI